LKSLINLIASTVTGDKSFRRYENLLYAGPKLAQSF